MSTLKILCPITIFMDTTEIDEKLPSLKMNTIIHIEQFLFNIDYKGTEWFLCEAIDVFTNNLKGTVNKAVLKNIDENFLLEIEKISDAKYKFDLSIQKRSIIDEYSNINYSSLIDDDIFSSIKNNFIDFPKWW